MCDSATAALENDFNGILEQVRVPIRDCYLQISFLLAGILTADLKIFFNI
jgi:hypothetical protein